MGEEGEDEEGAPDPHSAVADAIAAAAARAPPSACSASDRSIHHR